MNKLLVALLCSSVTFYSHATDYSKFQEFYNQFNFGFGFEQNFLKNGTNSVAGVSQQSYSLEVERLFNSGVWFVIDGSMVVNSITNQVNGLGSGNSAFNQMPSLGGINAKVGYTFLAIDDTFSITPYGLIGRNTNLTASTAYNNKDANITNDFYYTSGFGSRVGYNVNDFINLYADILISYNWDQSGPLGGIPPQNNMLYNATLGAKFNVYKQLQLGVNGFYNFYQNMASLPQDITGTSVYTPNNGYGGMVTVGLNY